MRWLTTWILLMVTLMVSFVSSEEDADNESRENSLNRLPVIEDEQVNGEFPKAGHERNLAKSPEGNFELGDVKTLDDRYIGYCDTAYILMWPGNSRKFWSYGYVYLIQPYLANCNMKYYYNTRNFIGDPFAKFGFTVTGSFQGQNGHFAHCTDTDYVMLNDTDGNVQYFCGPNATIEWGTSQNDFEFHFVTKPNSPRGKGFFVIIESVRLCGGSLNLDYDGPTGNLYTPLFPLKNYPPNIACTWYFAIPTNGSNEILVKIGCATFALQAPFNNGTNYCLDAVTFTQEIPGKISSYCSNSLNNNSHMVFSTHADFLMTFRSDSSVQKAGFNCTYEYIFYAE